MRVVGFLTGHRVLICDRDSKWTDGLRRIVQGAGGRIVLTPAQAPNANAYAERFVRSIRAECLDCLILFGERRLLRAIDQFVAHYHGERNHQGLRNELITRQPPMPLAGPRSAAGTGWAGCYGTTTARPEPEDGMSFRTLRVQTVASVATGACSGDVADDTQVHRVGEKLVHVNTVTAKTPHRGAAGAS